MKIEIEPIAHVRSPYNEKFGIPRQSCLVENSYSTIVFLPKFRKEGILKGIEGFSHLWLIWHFSENANHPWAPTVRPPRLGGNKRMGVFATRSPFRPNFLGLSCVKLIDVLSTEKDGTVLIVDGADLMDGTPIFDVKPYIPFTDAHVDATGSYATENFSRSLNVVLEENSLSFLSQEQKEALRQIIAQDPRPSYHDDGETYGFTYANYEIKFSVNNGCARVWSET